MDIEFAHNCNKPNSYNNNLITSNVVKLDATSPFLSLSLVTICAHAKNKYVRKIVTQL
jgi:hypothetical protein